MSAAWVGVVVNTTTMQIARIIVPSTDAGLVNERIVHGERLMRMPAAIYKSLGNRRDIAAYLGLVG
jgi:hypothetical protein